MLTVAAALLVLATPSAFEVTKDLEYRNVADQSLKADFYKPAKPLANPAPLIIAVHGGSWSGGKKEDMASICEALANQGFAVATVSYRLSPKHRWPAHIHDVQASVRYFRANAAKFGVNPDKIGMVGVSAGAHLALLTAFSPRWETAPADNPTVSSGVKCVFNIFGPVDLTQDFNPALAGLVSQQVMGIKYDPKNEVIIRQGPISHISKTSPPVFTIHGDKDQVVPVKQAYRLDEAMKANGREHTLRIVPGMGHNVDVQNPECAKALTEATEFLKKNLN